MKNTPVHLFACSVWYFAKQPWQVHWSFACCRLVQERSWLIVWSLGCLFMRLCKCVRLQQGKGSSSGPSNWICTCGRRPGFIWNQSLYSTLLHSPSYCLTFSISWLPMLEVQCSWESLWETGCDFNKLCCNSPLFKQTRWILKRKNIAL